MILLSPSYWVGQGVITDRSTKAEPGSSPDQRAWTAPHVLPSAACHWPVHSDWGGGTELHCTLRISQTAAIKPQFILVQLHVSSL